MRTLEAHRWAAVGAELGEGPVWDDGTGRLAFVDIVTGRLLSTADGDEVEVLAELDVPLGAALPAAEPGEYLLVTREGFRVRDADGVVQPLLDVLGDRPDLRFNDAHCDPAGRAVAGTLSLTDEPGQGTLYRLDDGPTVTPLLERVGLCNGLGWSPDGRTLYFADTLADRVDRIAWDPERGTVGERSPFAAVERPDGLCVDETGAVWIARWDGGDVRRYTPDGVLDTVVTLPVPHVTSCAFYGELLVVTTARATDADGHPSAPYAGDLFAVVTGTGAPPAPRWRPSLRAVAR